VEVEPVVGLEHIAQVITPDHGHYISSTCIQTIGEKAYVSYHTRGENYHGCIEVINLSEGECSILSFFEHFTLDFNHLIVDNSRIIAAGGEPKNGAFLGVINLNDGIFQTYSAEPTLVELEGASSTCVIRNGDYLHATTNEGYHTLDANSFSTVASIPTAGSSKFVYSDGTNTWTSGVLGYSIGTYCGSLAAKGGDIAGLAMATAVYGYHAKLYFG
jgi:hypothetical protein